MNSVLVSVLILLGVAGVTFALLFTASRLGVKLTELEHPGIFGFIGATFGVVVGMTTFFASEHYAAVRENAQTEATAAGATFAMSGAFPKREGSALRRQLYCYTHDVAEYSWPAMVSGQRNGSPIVERRELAVFSELLRLGRRPIEPENWYTNAVSSAIAMAEAREDRLLIVRPQIPVPLWFLIYVGAGLMIVFAFFFHRKSRRMLVGMLAAAMVMLMAVVSVLAGLDTPIEQPFAISAEAITHENGRMGLALGISPADGDEFCRRLGVPEFDEQAWE